MRRTTLMVDERLLTEAVRLSGARSYSDAVARGLTELVRRIKARGILDFAGSGLWRGELASSREDRPRRVSAPRRRRVAR